MTPPWVLTEPDSDRDLGAHRQAAKGVWQVTESPTHPFWALISASFFPCSRLLPSRGPHTQYESCTDCGWGQGHKISRSRWAQPARQAASTQQGLNESEALACVGPGGGASPQGKQMAPAARPSWDASADGTFIAGNGAELCRSNAGDLWRQPPGQLLL